MSALLQQVLGEVRQRDLLKAGDRVGVAVSGGIDSVALLRIFLELRGELGIVLSVVHFNHKLRGRESEADQQFVAGLANAHELEFFRDGADVAEHAALENMSLEAAARELRYEFFRRLLDSECGKEKTRPFPKLDKVITGHTLDDQAETVLMRIIRGTGVNGLGGIHPQMVIEDEHGDARGEIVRPLLATRRRDLEAYLNEIGQEWREDSTNSDHTFTRNRLRKLVLPLLEKEFNPAVPENLAELSEIARGEQEYWDNEVAGWMGTAVHWVEPDWVHHKPALVQISNSASRASSDGVTELEFRIDSAPWLVANASLSRPWFLSEPVAVQRRVVKAIGEHAGIPLDFRHVEQILRFADEETHSGRELSLPLGWKLVRHPEELLFLTPDLRDSNRPHDYEQEMAIPGRAVLDEIGIVIEARSIPTEQLAEYNPDELLDADSLPGPLRVRNWRAGDRFWPAHHKSPKKIKELLQERHVTQPERAHWPLMLSGEEIVWVRGFPTHARYRAQNGRSAILIWDRPWAEVDE